MIQFLYRQLEEACETRRGAQYMATIQPPRPTTRPGQAATRPMLGDDTAPLLARIRRGARDLGALLVTWRTMRVARVQCVHTVHLT